MSLTDGTKKLYAMIDDMTLEQLQELHGLLFDAINANKKLIQSLMQTDIYSQSYVKHIININGSLSRLDGEICLRITEIRNAK